MVSMELNSQEYARQLRWSSAWLRSAFVGVLSLLRAMRVTPVWMLLTMICAAEGVGAVYPLVWSARRSPGRQRAQEKWPVRIAFVGKSISLFPTVGCGRGVGNVG
jgi:hypothetical protein